MAAGDLIPIARKNDAAVMASELRDMVRALRTAKEQVAKFTGWFDNMDAAQVEALCGITEGQGDAVVTLVRQAQTDMAGQKVDAIQQLIDRVV